MSAEKTNKEWRTWTGADLAAMDKERDRAMLSVVCNIPQLEVIVEALEYYAEHKRTVAGRCAGDLYRMLNTSSADRAEHLESQLRKLATTEREKIESKYGKVSTHVPTD